MIFGEDLGRSAFFAEIGSEVERLDNIPSDCTRLVCIGQGVSISDTVGREYRIDLFISPAGCIAIRLPLSLAGVSSSDAELRHIRRVTSIVRAWSIEQLDEVCADHFYRVEGQAANIIDIFARMGFAVFSDKGRIYRALAETLAGGRLLVEIPDSEFAVKSLTYREIIDRFAAAKGIDPDDVADFLGTIEAEDGFCSMPRGHEIIVLYAPLGVDRPYHLFRLIAGLHRADVVAEPVLTRHQLQVNGRSPSEADNFFEALIPYADRAAINPAPDGSVSVLPLSIDALIDDSAGLIAASRNFAKVVST